MARSMELKEKLTTRNIIAVSTVGVFLYLTTFVILNGEEVAEFVAKNPGVSTSAALLVGALVAKVSDVYQFFFRKAQTTESS